MFSLLTLRDGLNYAHAILHEDTSNYGSTATASSVLVPARSTALGSDPGRDDQLECRVYVVNQRLVPDGTKIDLHRYDMQSLPAEVIDRLVENVPPRLYLSASS